MLCQNRSRLAIQAELRHIPGVSEAYGGAMFTDMSVFMETHARVRDKSRHLFGHGPWAPPQQMNKYIDLQSEAGMVDDYGGAMYADMSVTMGPPAANEQVYRSSE